jgi:hypothetical protein
VRAGFKCGQRNEERIASVRSGLIEYFPESKSEKREKERKSRGKGKDHKEGNAFFATLLFELPAGRILPPRFAGCMPGGPARFIADPRSL